MASEAEEPSFTPPRLLLIPKPLAYAPRQSPERSGTLTPPLHTSASVPFRWEEEPGKPREYCTTLIPRPVGFPQKCLELPPRLLIDTLPSPTTILEGPYTGKSSRFQSSSFRITGSRECYGSFRRTCSPEKGQPGTIVLGKRRVKEKGRFLGSWSWRRRRRDLKRNREAGGGSYVFPSSGDRAPADRSSNEEEEMISSSDKVKMTRMRSSGSSSAVSNARSQFWASVYEGLKQAVRWRSEKLKKNHGFVI